MIMDKIIKFWPQSDERVAAFMTEAGKCFYAFRDADNCLVLVEPVDPYVKNDACSVYVIFDNKGRKYHVLSGGEQVKSLDIVCNYVPACFLLNNILVVAELAEHVLAVPGLTVKVDYIFSQAKVVNLSDGSEVKHSLPKEGFYADVFVNALGNLVLRRGEMITQWGFDEGELKLLPFEGDDLNSWLLLGVMEPEQVGIASEDLRQLFDRT